MGEKYMKLCRVASPYMQRQGASQGMRAGMRTSKGSKHTERCLLKQYNMQRSYGALYDRHFTGTCIRQLGAWRTVACCGSESWRSTADGPRAFSPHPNPAYTAHPPAVAAILIMLLAALP